MHTQPDLYANRWLIRIGVLGLIFVGILSSVYAQETKEEYDLNQNRVVDTGDLLLVVDLLAQGDPRVNFNEDASTDWQDLFLFSMGWRKTTIKLPPSPVNVAPPLDPNFPGDFDDSIDFIFSGTDPIQVGVTPETIEATRAAVIRGTVYDMTQSPLPGIQVTILNHPEYGSTLTRIDGMFDLVVNGEQLLTVDYSAEGYLSVQRNVEVAWQDYTYVEDICMIALSPEVTVIDFESNPDTQVHEASVISDSDGTRQGRMIFFPQTRACVAMPDGSTQEVNQLSVRATEYTVGENGPAAMPAVLPPNSGYTYCVELSADEAIAQGASSVEFDKPFIYYLDNYLGIPVGQLVPVGTYDRSQGVWVPEENGRVVEILSIDEGKAVVDEYGDFFHSGDYKINFSEEELIQLAQLYEPGKTLWRVELHSFSPHDFNYPAGPPGDTLGPGQLPIPPGTKEWNSDCKNPGSILNIKNRTLGEQVKVTGTDFTLNYQSDRVFGRKSLYSIEIPVTPAEIPASLREVELRVSVAGNVFRKDFDTTPNQTYKYTWDGTDAYGRTVYGRRIATVVLNYLYTPQIYASGAERARAFGRNSTISYQAYVNSPDRSVIKIPLIYRVALGTMAFGHQELGGWSLNVHHTYDPSGVLFRGDGGRRDLDFLPDVLDTVAGNGNTGVPEDGARATATFLEAPWDFAFGPDGGIYITDRYHHRVYYLSPAGMITHFAGSGSIQMGGFEGDGGPANEARLNKPTGIAVAPDGTVYIADSNNFRIRRVDPDGIITTYAGTGEDVTSGDEGPAIEASFWYPGAMVIGPEGSLYFAELATRKRIRRITPDGIISTVTGGVTTSGNLPRPAIECSIPYCNALDMNENGELLIGAVWGVYKISSDGIMDIVAGGGSELDDGGEALNARISSAQGVTFAPEGGFYFDDRDTHKIRFVSRDGLIDTFSGTGVYGYVADGSPAMSAALSSPRRIKFGPDGLIYFLDAGNNRLRRFVKPFKSTVLGGDMIPSHDGSEAFVFDAKGRHIQTLEGYSGALRYGFDYDEDDRLISVTDAAGNITTIERTEDGAPTAIIAPGGQRTGLEVDEDGFLKRIIDTSSRPRTMTYHEGGLLHTFMTPTGAASTSTYDDQGNLAYHQDADGGSISLDMETTDNGFVLTKTTEMGRTTTFEYEVDSLGRNFITRTDPSGISTTQIVSDRGGVREIVYSDGSSVELEMAPDPRWGMLAPFVRRMSKSSGGEVVLEVFERRQLTTEDPLDPFAYTFYKTLRSTENGHYIVIHTYKPQDRTYTRSTNLGSKITYELDEKGRIVSVQKDPDLDPIVKQYDDKGRLERMSQGDNFFEWTYDALNRPIKTTNAAGESTSFSYNTADRIAQATTPSGSLYRLGYDSDGNFNRVIMPNSSIHDLEFTNRGHLSSYTPQDAPQPFVKTYNLDHQAKSFTMASGVSVQKTYDDGGRLSSETYPGTRIDYSYEDFQSSCCRRGAQVASMLRASLVSDETQSLEIKYVAGQVSGMEWEGAAQLDVDYTLDSLYRITQIKSVAPSEWTEVDLEWEVDGLLKKYENFTIQRGGPNRSTDMIDDGTFRVDYTYNNKGSVDSKLFTVDDAPIYQVSVQRDSAGRIDLATTEIDSVQTLFGYSYNLDGRLLQTTRNGANEAIYSYDSNGNRDSRQLGSGSIESAIFDSQDRIQQQGTLNYQYDEDGYPTVRGGDSLTYNIRGELLQIDPDAGETIKYFYDPLGRRISRTSGSETWQYFYADTKNQFALTHIIDPDGHIMNLYYDHQGALIAITVRSAHYYVATDMVGTPKVVSNMFGVVIKTLTHDSYGEVLTDSNPDFYLPIGYAGGLLDPDTGLLLFGFRDYDPVAGQWLTRDPSLFEGGQLNLYAYVDGDPINQKDPSGLESFCLSGSIYEIVGGGGQFCFGNDGLAFCTELGFGIGASVGGKFVDKLPKDGESIVAEGTVGCGPIKFNVGGEFDECGFTPKLDLNVGPLTIDKHGDATINTDVASLVDDVACEAEAKIVGQSCKVIPFR